jgi:hypothetical protein
MALYDKASLVLIPSGTKEGVVFSQKPTNGDGDFTFSRSTAATRVNADGLIEKETQNLLLQSNTFSNATWNKIRSSVTSGQSGYDGSSNAWKLESTDTTDSYLAQGLTQSGVQNFSVYAKSGNVDYIYFRIAGLTSQGSYVNLSDGSVSSSFNPSNIIGGTKITDVGNGWYKISIAVNTTTSDVRFYVSDSGLITSAIGSFIYIQDAQLEEGLVARDYIETTTAAVEGGITDNVPRLDYTGGATCPALLLEGQRTNLVTQSEYFGAWNKSTGAITITSNYGLSPDGSQNSSRVQFTAASQHINISTSLGIGVTSTGSVYIKGTAGETIKFETGGVGALRTLNGDWQRIEVTSVSASSLLLINTFGGATARDIEVYGAQCEAGVSYATSYIPTYGTSVTFANDVCNNAGNDQVINSAEGVLYAEISGFENDLSDRYISLSDGGANNSIRIFYYQDGGTTFFRKNVNAVQTTIFSTNTINKSELTKIAIKYNSTNFDIFSNGVKLSTNLDSNSFPINTLNEINFANADGLSQPFYGKTKQVLYFPTALSDAELIALTT